MSYRPIRYRIFTCKICEHKERKFGDIIGHLLEHSKAEIVKEGYKFLIRERRYR